jgi:hypothetical protein
MTINRPDVDTDGSEGRTTKWCVDCGTDSPPADERHTLISVKHGWRCTVTTDAAGRKALIWRCPQCWIKFRDVPR